MAVKMFFLSGETSNISYLHPEIWGTDPQFDLRIFFGLGGEKPPTRYLFIFIPILRWRKEMLAKLKDFQFQAESISGKLIAFCC